MSSDFRRTEGASSSNPATELAGWLYLGVLAFAPFAYGGLRSNLLAMIQAGLAASLILWLLGLAIGRRGPRVPWWITGSAVGVVAFGWWRALPVLQPDFAALPVADAGTFLPVIVWLKNGAASANRTLTAVVEATLVAGALLLAADLSADARWRLRLWRGMAVAGMAVALLGLAQKLSGAPGIYWQHEWRVWSYFGPFHYHGNAGAFLNLVWPLLLGFLLAAFLRRDAPWARALWMPALLFCLAAVFVNMSKAAMVVAVGLAVLLGAWHLRLLGRTRFAGRRWMLLGAALAGVGAVGAVVHLVGWEFARNHWARLLAHWDEPGWRGLAYALYPRMLAESGWLGFGPGAWAEKFAVLAPARWKDLIVAHCPYAHQDYWQVLLEWGAPGIAGAAVIVGAALTSGVRALRRFPPEDTSRRRLLLGSTLAAVLGVLAHAGIDFPLQVPAIQLYVATLLGTLLGAAPPTKSARASASADRA